MNRIIDILHKSKDVMVITGAGISTGSGIRDFRGEQGLYKEKYLGESPDYWMSDYALYYRTDKFYQFMYDILLNKEYRPNSAHYNLKKLEDMGIIHGIVTQNIDNLHQEAGSKNVIDLHGNLNYFKCTKCKHRYTREELDSLGREANIPICKHCGDMVRPDIVLYGESPNRGNFNRAANMCAEADTILVLGSSLVVSTVRNILGFCSCNDLIIVNKGETAYDCEATVKLDEDIEDTLDYIVKNI